MRTIKFRIWDDKLKVLYTPEMNERVGDLWKLPAMYGGILKITEEIKVMQFTGLKDKNGKEIYEGDLLNKKTTFENNMADRRFQPPTELLVDFEIGQFINKYSNESLFDAMKTISSFRHKSWTDYEIIGNIYENPELL